MRMYDLNLWTKNRNKSKIREKRKYRSLSLLLSLFFCFLHFHVKKISETIISSIYIIFNDTNSRIQSFFNQFLFLFVVYISMNPSLKIEKKINKKKEDIIVTHDTFRYISFIFSCQLKINILCFFHIFFLNLSQEIVIWNEILFSYFVLSKLRKYIHRLLIDVTQKDLNGEHLRFIFCCLCNFLFIFHLVNIDSLILLINNIITKELIYIDKNQLFSLYLSNVNFKLLSIKKHFRKFLLSTLRKLPLRNLHRSNQKKNIIIRNHNENIT